MLYSGGNRLPKQEVNSGTPVIENIHYENIRCKYSKLQAIQIIGLPEMPVKNVSFKNLELGGEIGIEINDSKNISFENLTLSCKTGPPVKISYCDSININSLNIKGPKTEKLPILLNDISNIKLSNINYASKKGIIKISGKAENIETDKSIPGKKIFRE